MHSRTVQRCTLSHNPAEVRSNDESSLKNTVSIVVVVGDLIHPFRPPEIARLSNTPWSAPLKLCLNQRSGWCPLVAGHHRTGSPFVHRNFCSDFCIASCWALLSNWSCKLVLSVEGRAIRLLRGGMFVVRRRRQRRRCEPESTVIYVCLANCLSAIWPWRL